MATEVEKFFQDKGTGLNFSSQGDGMKQAVCVLEPGTYKFRPERNETIVVVTGKLKVDGLELYPIVGNDYHDAAIRLLVGKEYTLSCSDIISYHVTFGS